MHGKLWACLVCYSTRMNPPGARGPIIIVIVIIVIVININTTTLGVEWGGVGGGSPPRCDSTKFQWPHNSWVCFFPPTKKTW